MSHFVYADGKLHAEQVPLERIAAEFGTPCYVYDEGELRSRCREYREAFPGGVAYASKAFLCTAMARLVAEGRDGVSRALRAQQADRTEE